VMGSVYKLFDDKGEEEEVRREFVSRVKDPRREVTAVGSEPDAEPRMGPGRHGVDDVHRTRMRSSCRE
jgi:hypothetical protein